MAVFGQESNAEFYLSVVAAAGRSNFLPPKDQRTDLQPGFGISRHIGVDHDLISLLEIAAISPPAHHFGISEKNIIETIAYLLSH